MPLTLGVSSLDYLTKHAQQCNVFATAVVLIPGLVGLTKAKKLNTSQRNSLPFWLFQWLVFLFIFITLGSLSGPPPAWLPALVDLQSIFAVGFFFSFLQGDSYDPGAVWIGLFVTMAIFAAVDLGLGFVATTQPAGSGWRYAWIAPSEVLAVTALVMQGGVFMLRYGLMAIWLLVADVVYAMLQQPIYSGVFVELHPQQKWFLAVAVGKLVLGGLFYLYFFAPLEEYHELKLPPPSDGVKEKIKKRLKIAGGIALSVATVFGEEVIRALIAK